MTYLIDTHIFLWTLFASKKIPSGIRKILLDTETNKYVSVITFWEISLKFSLDKLDLRGAFPDDLPSIAKKAKFEILNIDADSVSSYYKLPKSRHKDPFDRMLAWQAIRKDCFLLTADRGFIDYRNNGLRIIS